MALAIEPAVDQWITQTDAFIIVFRAYDDNGQRCKHNQMSVQYNITYDGTMPDLTQMTRIYGDASGLVTISITKPCVISVYGTYLRDINDPSSEVTQEVVINQEITFQPIIMDINATYTGPDIPITENFKASDVIVKAKLSDGTQQIIDINKCEIPFYEITMIGPNLRQIIYDDPVAKVKWKMNVTIWGIAKLLSLEADYTGSLKLMGDRIYPFEVYVQGLFLIDDGTQELRDISEEDWWFVDIPIINELNKGTFTVQHQDKTDTIEVPYELSTALRLNVWYEGDKIEVGKSYDPNNLVIYLSINGERYRIDHKLCTISSLVIYQEGWNWFDITYINQFDKVTQRFPVPGIILKHYIDLDFKVLYIRNMNEQEDFTETFKESMTFDSIFTISWESFLKVVNYLKLYGLYHVTVPKLSGLSNQYDAKWAVMCNDETTLKATIIKIYNEEETKNGEETDIPSD